MINTKKKRNLLNIVLLVAGIVVSIIATYKTVYFGCDIDESYAITLSYRLVMGDHLFKEMWEVHQTSAIFMAPLIWIYRRVVGNTIGMVVFLRMAGCVIQCLVAICLYRSLSKHIDKRSACIMAFVFYNFSPKYLSVLEFCFLQYLFLTLLLICFLDYMHDGRKWHLIGMGLAMAGTVLAYPQTFFFVPLEYFLLWLIFKNREDGKKAAGNLFRVFGAEAVCGILFLGYVLMYVSPSELIENIPMILADQSHSMPLIERIVSLVVEFFRFGFGLFVILFIYEMVGYIYKKKKGTELSWGREACLLVCMTVWLIPMLIYDGQPGIRHLDTFYLIFAPLIGLGYLNLRTAKRHAMSKYIRMMQGIMLAVFCGCCIGSNLTIYANSGLLLPLLYLVWMEYLLNREAEQQDKGISRTAQNISFLLLLLLCAGFLTARCTLVRFTSVQPKTVFEDMYQIGVGTGKGLYVTEKEHIQYHSKMATLQKYVGVEDTVFYMGSDTYLSFLIGNQIAVPTSISTPIYDHTVIEYYARYPYKMPDIIFVDKYYVNLSEMQYEGEFGEWLRENYDLEHVIDEDFAQIVYRKQGDF